MKVTGKITKVLDKVTGQKKDGSGEWVKQSFILDNNEKYNNIFCFELFGDEKVENFNKYNSVGQFVDVEFNVSTNEWQGKYFTSLQCWKVFKAEVSEIDVPAFTEVSSGDLKEVADDLLPF